MCCMLHIGESQREYENKLEELRRKDKDERERLQKELDRISETVENQVAKIGMYPPPSLLLFLVMDYSIL